ncbi:MAG: PA2778 family cysteine peptidase [Bdellovibrio sp.]
MRALFPVLLGFLVLGCASATPQIDKILGEHNISPNSKLIENVPFIQQQVGHCGPATLAMVLNWAGQNISADNLAKQVFTPGLNGSLQSDMISASRRLGMMAVPIEGFNALLEEIKAGHPVIVFENLSVSWLPQWHYAVVFGYDLPDRKIIMHSGPEAFKRWDMQTFERSWMLGNYWGLVVLPAGQLAATASELSHGVAASALESIGRSEAAAIAYRSILQRWSKNLVAQVGLANIAFTRKRYQEAVRLLRQAAVDHPTSAIVSHNLAVAEVQSRIMKEGL